MHPDEPLLRHLAENVLGLRRYDPQTVLDQPDGTYALINGSLRVVDHDSKFAFLRPLEDANDALSILYKSPVTVAVGMHGMLAQKDEDGYFDCYVTTFCRIICVGAAKATGWKE